MMATYYVKTDGDDAKDGLSEANAWEHIDYAMTQVAAGDTVNVKSGEYTEKATIRTAGTATSPITWRGYKTTPGDAASNLQDEQYMAQITATGQQNGIAVDAAFAASADLYNVFENIIVYDATNHGIDISNGNGNQEYCTFFNCSFNGNGGNGVYTAARHRIILCAASENTLTGIETAHTSEVIACLAFDNGPMQIHASCLVLGCLIFDIPVDGVGIYSSYNLPGFVVSGCAIDGDGNSGTKGIFQDSALGGITAINNIIHRVDTGIQSDGDTKDFARGFNNLININSGGTALVNYTNIGGIYSAPLFVDDDNRDYRLLPGSPALQAAWPATAGKLLPTLAGFSNYGDLGVAQRLQHERPSKIINIGMQT
ncbi:MAG: right-handed parallel beta-helix repeat-containing protein [Planctomycetota bacterium]|jgi:hypothetical protein